MINKTMSSFLRIVISCSILIVVYSNTFLNLNNVSIIFEKPPVSFFIVSFNWLIAALLTKNYDRSFNNNFKEFSNPFFKSYMIILVFSFPFIDDTYLLMQFISGLLLLELFMFFLIHKYKMWFNFKNKISHIVDFGQILENQQQSLQIPDKELFFVDESISSTLNNVRSNNSVFSKKMGATKESQTSEDRLAIKEIHSDTDFENIGTYCLLCITPTVNDFNNINTFLSQIYNTLEDGGYAILNYIPLESRKKSLKLNKLDFILHRAIPRLPIFEWIYFAITKGRNKALSRAEVWGRIYYGGFEVLKEEKSENKINILIRKKYDPSVVSNPSYYPVVKLDRVGLGGKIIKINKIRSMHPYSEFIQKKIFEMHALSSAGKFKHDFRITGWGRLIRKFWIDEIPQILDWLRGNIKIVGIRAMSIHYFSLYPKRYQDKYCLVKPGFLSPIFDEKNAGFDNIVKVEEEYLDGYLANPLLTDIKYFFRILGDITLRGIRSY